MTEQAKQSKIVEQVQKQVEKVNLEAAKDFQKQVSDKIVDLTTDI